VVRSIYPPHGDTIYTDAKGRYAFAFNDTGIGGYKLKFEDIDGEENGGLFLPKEIGGDFTQAIQAKKGDGKWYDGKFIKTENVALEEEYYGPLYGVRCASFQP
jgi:putative lipoprotein (rSAM/lipoprotein system)